MAQDEIAIPVHEVREQDVVLLVLDDRRMDAQERLRVRAYVLAGWEVVGLVLGSPSHERRMLLTLVQVIGKTASVVEDLREPAQTHVRCGVVGSHDLLGGQIHRILQQDPLGSLEGDVAQTLVRRPDPIVGSRRGSQPALAQFTAIAEVVGTFGESQASPRRQEVPADPGWLQSQDAIAIGKRLLEVITPCVDDHPSPIYHRPHRF